jgi:hypothetical protein
MDNLSTFPEDTVQGTPQEDRWFLRLWYQITSPPDPGDSASFEERELFRRGRTGSQITIFLFIVVFMSFPAAFAGSNSLLIAILIAALFLLIFAMVLNHFKMVNIAGIMVVLIAAAGPIVNILTTPGGVNTAALSIFGLLVLPLMCAVSFLPPWSVFIVAAGNCLFTLYALMFMPSSGELHQVLKEAFPGVVTPILVSQGIIAIMAFLWVKGATRALVRADRAEEIARLEHDMVLQGAEEVAAQKQQLDLSIKKIVETHARVANGDFDARVPLTEDNVLWQISGSLNNLLSRLQRLRLDAARGQQMQKALNEAHEEIARLKNSLAEYNQSSTGY